MFKTGGATLIFIVVLSLVVVTIAIERVLVLWRFLGRAYGLVETVERCLRRGAWAEARSACERSPSPVADILLVGFERHGRSTPDVVAAAVERERQRVALGLRRWLWILGTIGASSPFVGLLGTVWGTMRAMYQIGAQHQAGIDVVGPGIAEALVTTAAGIIVAIESMVIYNYFMQRLGRTSLELKLMAEEFVELLREQKPDPRAKSGEAREVEATPAVKPVSNEA
jgi:biopolymer transport protein ExbB/TolQ